MECDIFELIKSARYSQVLSKIKLNKTQRSLISQFKNYNMNIEKPFRVDKIKAKASETHDLDFFEFDPKSDLIDHMILY